MDQPRLSGRATSVPASPIRKLIPYADQARASGVRVYQLNIGQPDVRTPEAFLAAVRGFSQEVLSYTPSDGLRSFRDGLVGYYASLGVRIGADDLVVTTGGSEAISMALAACCDPGDEVLLFEPCYTNYIGISAWLGIACSFVTLDPKRGYHLPPAREIERRIGPRTRAMVICNPNNPTGTIHTRGEIETLARIARERGLFLIADEVYREFAFDGEPPVPVLSLTGLERHAIQVDSVSKRYSACGARIGWAATRDKEVRAAMLRMGQARLAAPTIGQVAALATLSIPPAEVSAMVAEYKARRDILVEALSRVPGVSMQRPEGAFYAMATLPIDDADRFCAWLLTDFSHRGATVMLAPGAGFYGTPGLGRQEVRIAYVIEGPDLEKAVEVLAAALKVYPGRT